MCLQVVFASVTVAGHAGMQQRIYTNSDICFAPQSIMLVGVFAYVSTLASAVWCIHMYSSVAYSVQRSSVAAATSHTKQQAYVDSR